MIIFSRKIKCSNCGKNFKAKKERGRRVYVDSSYDNYGKCKRNVFSQDYFTALVRHRYGGISDAEIRERVKLVEIRDKDHFTIHFKDDSPIIFGENYIHF